MTDIRMVSHSAALNQVLTSASRKILTRRSQEVLLAAQASAGGAMKGTLGYAVEGSTYHDMSSKVGSSDKAAIFEEYGTKPHIIRPRNARVLKFPGTRGFSGKTIYATIVHHPGTSGKHTLRNALRKVIGRAG